MLKTEDLIPLYLLEHPEDEKYFHYAIPNGCIKPDNLVELDASVRFSLWGVKEGYFTWEDHLRLVEIVNKTKQQMTSTDND